jgi:hypothetical protein
MSIKKELLDEFTLQQLKEIAENKGIKFKRLSKTQKEYYEDWDEKEKLVDIMTGKEELTIKEIEGYIKTYKEI